MKRLALILVLSTPFSALSGQILRCPDGTYREAPCEVTYRPAQPPLPAPVAAPPAEVLTEQRQRTIESSKRLREKLLSDMEEDRRKAGLTKR